MVSSSELTRNKKHQKQTDDLKLLSSKTLEHTSLIEVALLSKRQARKLLRIGNQSLTKLINKGEIKTIRINDRDKISFVNIKDFIIRNNRTIYSREIKSEILNEETSISNATKIINDILKEFN
ncbi:MAG: hypothetical protein NTY74_14590 [Ignavibacteriae bacterium]|nr:hypothetical protein [Ignavibacteriota bacterium]